MYLNLKQQRFPENLVLDHDLNAWVSSEDKSKPVIEAGTRMRLRITFATANAQMLVRASLREAHHTHRARLSFTRLTTTSIGAPQQAAVAAIDDDYLGPIGKSD